MPCHKTLQMVWMLTILECWTVDDARFLGDAFGYNSGLLLDKLVSHPGEELGVSKRHLSLEVKAIKRKEREGAHNGSIQPICIFG